MPYTAERPAMAEDAEQLRARIPGWGVDLDPNDRPAVPRERFDPLASSDGLARQEEKWPRERSMEHLMLPPVFGTSCPPKGVSGAIRKLAYARYSEARAAHWLLLLAADRVDRTESVLASFATTRPDNPITQTGILSEFRRHGWRSRVGRDRADLSHLWMDPVIVGAPWALGVYGASKATRRLRRRLRS